MDYINKLNGIGAKKADKGALLYGSNFKSLIELGSLGHFPLFYPQWLGQYRQLASGLKSTSHTKKLSRKIIERVNKHRSLDRKRTVLLSLSSKELMIFIHEFLKLVETKVLDKKPEIH